MANFLNTTGVSYHLENLINNSQEKLILISPFLKINDRIKELLRDKNTLKIDIRIIYGKSELQPEDSNWLKNLNYVRLSFCKNLHAKCYLNEKEAIITSMNLYEFSQINNNEMGIYFSKKDDPALYRDIEEEARRLIRSSEEVKVSVEKVVREKYSKSVKNRKSNNGFCIRCKKIIRFDRSHPYCKDCYRVWKIYKNEDYEEKFCHRCGGPNNSTLNKPICNSCYNKIGRV